MRCFKHIFAVILEFAVVKSMRIESISSSADNWGFGAYLKLYDGSMELVLEMSAKKEHRQLL
jgi:hypothetical protein